MIAVQTIRVLIVGALLLHAVAHGIAFAALVAQSLGGPSTSRVPVRSWLLPSLHLKTAATVAIPFWLVAALGFAAASMSFWGILVRGEAWGQLALTSATVSIVGIGLFSGIWPGSPKRERSILNTLVALAMDVAILFTQLIVHWPPEPMFGK